MECELDRRIWAIVTADGVMTMYRTYERAVEYSRKAIIIDPLLAGEIYITTNDAADRILNSMQKEKAA